MKKTILVLLLASAFQFAYAQSDTTKIEQYCSLVCRERLFTNKIDIQLDFGEDKYRGLRYKDSTGKVMTFNSLVDAMNYMGKNGWKLVNGFVFSDADNVKDYRYIFKKEFLKSSLAD